MTFYPVTPVPAPRMTQSDRWKERPCVMRYRHFCDHIRELGATLESGDTVVFHMSKPQSWSMRRKIRMTGQPHTVKPDLDNLLKALMDALHKNDSHISSLHVSKVWADALCGISIKRGAEVLA